VEMEGFRFGFLTCYDFYFYEGFSRLARQNLDIIIGCSHQRSDLHSALETSAKFLCYQTNAYLLRSSVSMGADSDVGGCSLIATPRGEILGNLKNDIGLLIREIDVTEKYRKPAGFGRPLAAHYEYIEEGRRPGTYRNGGSAIIANDLNLSYPRVCAHRGFNTVAPENTLPAYGAAVALGADEIEFDLWWTKDGEIVSCHDSTLDRVSTGTGKIYDHTYGELLAFDFGVKYGEKFKGLKILKFEEILAKFACHTVMNIHIKTPDWQCEYDPEALRRIIALIDQYDCRKYVYFMSGNENVLRLARELAPDICRCAGAGNAPWEIVDRAIKYECKKVQLHKSHFNREMIRRAHQNGIICNLFWSDDPEEAREFIAMGIDTILTNDFHLISQAVKR